MDTLLAEGIRLATHFLDRGGGFFPFGVALTTDGEVHHIPGYTGEEQPGAEELIADAAQALRELAAAGKVRATALVSDVRLGRPETAAADAIRVQLEHLRGRPVTCYLPYALAGGKVVRGELLAESGTAAVFPTRGGKKTGDANLSS
jgi:hypothetical protein